MADTTVVRTGSQSLEQSFVGADSDYQAKSYDITRRLHGEPVPLSLVQEQLWRQALSSSGSYRLHHESIAISRTGPLDVPTLERAFTEIIRRHEAWRTTFGMVDGQLTQVIHPRLGGPLI